MNQLFNWKHLNIAATEPEFIVLKKNKLSLVFCFVYHNCEFCCFVIVWWHYHGGEDCTQAWQPCIILWGLLFKIIKSQTRKAWLSRLLCHSPKWFFQLAKTRENKSLLFYSSGVKRRRTHQRESLFVFEWKTSCGTINNTKHFFFSFFSPHVIPLFFSSSLLHPQCALSVHN